MVVRDRELTPNHLDKRRRIVEAAQALLLRDGRAACTTRAIASEGVLAASLIHYYFNSVDEIVDAVMQDLLAEIRDGLNAVAERHREPVPRLWGVIDAHIHAFVGRPQHSKLWIDYWLATDRAGDASSMARVDDMFCELYTDLLTSAGADRPSARARVICAYLIGLAARRGIHPERTEHLDGDLAIMTGRPRPVPPAAPTE
ncbi:TetR/AcrR family transcriptional regulator [Mycobacterium sp.]|uniref:TetR/AcrR family transcriptional regulator n=1 Tax=Mycobacterium sp. TaxID=1785 RepID=UPI003BB10673